MMRKTICRTLTRATITAYRIAKVDGKPTVEQLEPITAWGDVTEKEAEKLVVQTYGKGTILNAVELVKETYQIDVDKFVANAMKVEQLEIPMTDDPEPIEE